MIYRLLLVAVYCLRSGAIAVSSLHASVFTLIFMSNSVVDSWFMVFIINAILVLLLIIELKGVNVSKEIKLWILVLKVFYFLVLLGSCFFHAGHFGLPHSYEDFFRLFLSLGIAFVPEMILKITFSIDIKTK